MEKKLKMLFDYQRFEKNAKLEKLISETEDSFANELSDDELFFVNAAGEPDLAGGSVSNIYNVPERKPVNYESDDGKTSTQIK